MSHILEGVNFLKPVGYLAKTMFKRVREKLRKEKETTHPEDFVLLKIPKEEIDRVMHNYTAAIVRADGVVPIASEFSKGGIIVIGIPEDKCPPSIYDKYGVKSNDPKLHTDQQGKGTGSSEESAGHETAEGDVGPGEEGEEVGDQEVAGSQIEEGQPGEDSGRGAPGSQESLCNG